MPWLLLHWFVAPYCFYLLIPILKIERGIIKGCRKSFFMEQILTTNGWRKVLSGTLFYLDNLSAKEGSVNYHVSFESSWYSSHLQSENYRIDWFLSYPKQDITTSCCKMFWSGLITKVSFKKQRNQNVKIQILRLCYLQLLPYLRILYCWQRKKWRMEDNVEHLIWGVMVSGDMYLTSIVCAMRTNMLLRIWPLR